MKTFHPAVNLAGGGAGGQGEIQPIHQSGLIHPGETIQGGLGLAGSGLGFYDD